MVDCRDIALSELMEKALERRKHLAAQRFNYGYHVEAADEPGTIHLAAQRFNYGNHVEAADEPGTVLYTWPHNYSTMDTGTTWRRQMNQVFYTWPHNYSTMDTGTTWMRQMNQVPYYIPCHTTI